jgi:hypothetical protein
MELEGTIIFDLPLQEGVSKAGRPWKKKEWVLETPGMYPRRVKFHVFGDRVDMLNFEVGKSYAVTFELESREFNGRWYTDVNVLSARPSDGMTQAAPAAFGQAPAAAPAQPAPAAPAMDPFAGADNSTDDLPF